MNSDTSNWYDFKYGYLYNKFTQAPTIDDILEVIASMETQRLPERIETIIEEKLKKYLFDLEQNGGYTPSRHQRTQFLLELVSAFEIAPHQRENYKTRFKKALEKHKDKIPGNSTQENQ